jgi:hypothetical protein
MITPTTPLNTHMWVLQTSLPNAFQHIAMRTDGRTARQALCGKRRVRGYWYSGSTTPHPGVRLCSACTRLATDTQHGGQA